MDAIEISKRLAARKVKNWRKFLDPHLLLVLTSYFIIIYLWIDSLHQIQAVDSQLRDDHKVIGIGSGSTIVYAVERIKQLVDEKNLKIKCVPTSFQVSTE